MNKIYTKNEVQEIAQNFINDNFTTDNIKFEIYSFIKKYGNVIYSDEYYDDFVTIENNKFLIKFTPNTSNNTRNLFCKAIAIGYYILYKNDSPEIQIFKRDNKILNTQAVWFATEILMPINKFKEKFKEFNGNIKELSFYFNVSVAHARIRAVILKL